MASRPTEVGRYVLFLFALTLPLLASTAYAQEAPPPTPAFTVSTSHVFSTKESPSISLTHRQIDHLDFRVYKVNDAFAFFEKLRDPHQLGSEEPIVPQERTLLERIAIWKAARRSDIRNFLRRQVTWDYRTARRERRDKEEVVLRRALNVNTFAQVPLLNPSQLVTSWREVLPPVREAEYRHVPLDLSAPGVYVVEAVNPPLRAYTVVVISDVGLVTKTAPNELLVFAANRFSGEPLGNCEVRVLADQKTVGSGVTAADGTFKTDVTVTTPDNLVTLATCNGQTAATDPGAYTVHSPSRDLVGYTYTDRPVYRPGHTVYYKSVLRWRERGELAAFPANSTVEVSVADTDDKVLVRERKPVDAFGALTGSFVIPPTASLGYYTVRVTSDDDTATGSFEVQEYRKPEFDVAVRPASRLELQGRRVRATVAARYYFGQPVAGAAVTYAVYKQGYYSPLRYDAGGDESEFGGGDYAGGEQIYEGRARLNAEGLAEISVALPVDEEGRDFTARIEARVVDASSREVAGASSVTATYGRFLLIARPDRYIHQANEAFTIAVRALDYTGAPQNAIRVHAALERVEYRGYNNPPSITTLQEGDVETDESGRAQWSTTAPSSAGGHRVRVTASADGRTVSDTAYIYVPGALDVGDSDQFLELTSDKRTYAPGETASLVAQGVQFDASVLVTKESQHVSYHQVVKVRGGEAIQVPITGDDVGDTYVSIAFLKDDRLYRAERRLGVPANDHRLTITAEADRTVIRPGEPGTFTLRVTDAKGAPVTAQLSVGLVDEALYGVRPDHTPDPLRFFYRREYNRVGTMFSRDYSFVGYSGTEQLLLTQRRRPMTLADFKADRPDRPRVRKDFPDTVLWIGNATTDAEGKAEIKVDYPDSLTSWRLTVRGVTVSTDVGVTTTNTTTTKDLILRVINPRFLTEGDRVSVPTVVHNYLPTAKTVSVSLAAEGLTPDTTAANQATGGGAEGARTLEIPQNGQQRTDWAFLADRVQPATLTGKATSDVAGDAMQVTLPVLPAGLQRNTGSSGSILQAGEQTIALTIPPTANASGRSVRVSLAPSLAGTMLGALDYLTSFPWGCTEQTLSSFIPNLAVLRALTDMQLQPTERLRSLDRQVSDGLTRLYDYQHDDGGWGWWKTDQNDPFMTAYAVDGLVQAREHGVRVQEWRIASGAGALRRLYDEYPRAIPDLKAYELYVLQHAGEADGEFLATALNDLWSARGRMTPTGQALLLLTLDRVQDERGNVLASELVSRAETRGDLSWWTAGSDPLLEDFADTSVEASALALKAIAARDPQNPLLERAARWLVANRTAGSYWVSTKQTAIALDGLLAYMRARNERPAPVTAEVFVNGTRVATQSFDAASLAAPNPVLVEAPAVEGANSVRIVTQGAGAVYYDAGVRYYDRPAASERTGTRRLALARRYSTLTPVTRNGRIIYREGPFNGTANPGDLLLVRVTAAGAADWRYLMIEDPIPAGTEQVEREEGYELERRMRWFYGSERQFRDDRTVFFLNRFDQGRYDFTYILRVTTPGTFAAMPARISPMYVPDVSASSETTTMTVGAGTVR